MKRMVTKTEIVETIDEAIGSGELPISGGTKLYKHTINYGTGGTVNIIETISTRKEAYTASQVGSSGIAWREALKAVAGPILIVTNVSQSGPSTFSAYGVNQSGSSSSVQLGSGFVSDTVTEL